MFLRRTLALAAAASVAFSPALADQHKKDKQTPKADIVDTAASAGGFEMLVAAVQAAGLEETLRGEGPYTVFAPTDEAFAALPAGALDSLLMPENREQLVSILTYHVLPGKTKAKDVSGAVTSAATVNGGALTVDGRDGVKVNNATVVQADIWASNGVIHVIDAVLMPPSAE